VARSAQTEALAQELQARLAVAEVRLSEVVLQRSQLDELMLSLSRSRDDTLVHDFLFAETPRMVHVCNAPSPAATSAIPIGQMIAEKILKAR
jgi:hypothetical protein